LAKDLTTPKVTYHPDVGVVATENCLSPFGPTKRAAFVSTES
jgi:hypothetical protein